MRLAQATGVSEDWLIQGLGDAPSHLVPLGQPTTETVPLMDIADPESVTFPVASAEWLHHIFKLKAEEVVWFHAPDTSMWPEIFPGDPVLCRRIEPVLPDIEMSRLLLVRYQDKLILRVVSVDRKKPQEVVMHAWLSPRFPPVRAARKDVEGIGEMLWSGRRWDTDPSKEPSITEGALKRRRPSKARV